MTGVGCVQGEVERAGFVQPGEGKAKGELPLSSALWVVIEKPEPDFS